MKTCEFVQTAPSRLQCKDCGCKILTPITPEEATREAKQTEWECGLGYQERIEKERAKEKLRASNLPHVKSRRKRQPQENEEADFSCTHRLEKIRNDKCNLCGVRGQEFEVLGCDIHKECSIGRRHSKVRNCVTCQDRQSTKDLPIVQVDGGETPFINNGHLVVNVNGRLITSHAGKPAASGKTFQPTKPIINPKSNKLIITIAIGETFQELLKVTGPLMQKYADKCGADFIALTDTTQSWWGLEKFRVAEYLLYYDRLVFFDADCIIRPTCPNLFDIVPSDSFGAHNDWELIKYFGWHREEWHELMRSQGKKMKPPSGTLLNTGVVVCSTEHLPAWLAPTKPMSEWHCDEQLWIEYNVIESGMPVFWFDIRFNTQWYMDDFPKLENEAFIIHLANCPPDLRLVKAKEYAK